MPDIDLAHPLTKKEAIDLAQVCLHDKMYFAKTFFPERFDVPFSQGHRDIFDIFQDRSVKKGVVLASRGFGKTSVNLVNQCHEILFGLRHFIVPVSCTNTQAVMISENVKTELERNPYIKAVFGTMKAGKASGNDMYNKDMWVARRPDDRAGTLIMPRGSQQQIRGVLYGSVRPQLIIGDDLEETEKVASDEQRTKLKKWFFEDLVNAVSRTRHDWQIYIVGTLLHEDSLLANLLEDPSWDHVHLSLCDEMYNSNWPEAFSNEDILQLVEEFKAQGMLDSFYREYMNMPIASEDATFTTDMFQKYREDSEEFKKVLPRLITMILVDPAKTVNSKSAKSAIIAASVDIRDHRIYVRECWSDMVYPDYLYEKIAEMSARWRTGLIGVEVNSLSEFIKQPMRNFLGKTGRSFNIIDLHPRGGKEDRAKWLAPYYRNHSVYHNETGNCEQLEMSLRSFPRPKYWDLIDCMAYIVQMLSVGGAYFDPSLSEDSEEEYISEMARLEQEDRSQEPLPDWGWV